MTHNTYIYTEHNDTVLQCPYLFYSSAMDIMLNNTDITLQINYKTLELDGFCTIRDTLDYEHFCVDLAEYCEYCKKTVM